MQDISAQILAAIKFSQLTAIITVAGLALIALSFLSFIFNKSQDAASGNIDSDRRNDDDEEKDDD